MSNPTFPGFDYPIEDLSAYAFCIDTFVISLTNKKVIRFFPENAAAFRRWLDSNHVRDITSDTGSLIINYYHKLK